MLLNNITRIILIHSIVSVISFVILEVPQLRVDGARSPRARFPNANPEIDQWPIGWVSDAKAWLPAKKPSSKPQFVGVVNELIQTRNEGLSVNKSKPYSGGDAATDIRIACASSHD